MHRPHVAAFLCILPIVLQAASSAAVAAGDGVEPMHAAAWFGHSAVRDGTLRLLLAQSELPQSGPVIKAPEEVTSEDGPDAPNSPPDAVDLVLAIRDGNMEAVRTLLSRGANANAIPSLGTVPSAPEGEQFPPLFEAILVDDEALIMALVEAGVNFKASYRVQVGPSNNSRRFSAIDFAVWFGKPVAVDVLFRLGVDLDRKNGGLAEPLERARTARYRGHETIATMLDTVREEANLFNDVVESGDLEEVRRLLDMGADPNRAGQEEDGRVVIRTPLIVAVETGNPEMFELLVAAGANPKRTVWAYFSKPYDLMFAAQPIHVAARLGDIDMIRRLLDLGVDVDVTHEDEGGGTHTPLSHAVRMENIALVRFLIENGADPAGRFCGGNDCWPETYLEVATRLGNVDLVRLFAAAGNPVDRPPEELSLSDGFVGRTPLMIAAEYGRTSMMSVLIDEFGAAVSTRNGHGCAAIGFAVFMEHEAAERMLRNAGAEPDRSTCQQYAWHGK